MRNDDAVGQLPEWAHDHIDELEALAAHASAAVHGDHLVHLDFRADNVLIDAAHEAWIIDWPWAGIGARWLDAVTFLLDARLHEIALDFDSIINTHPLFTEASFDDVNAELAALTGYFFDGARQPAPRNMPTLRAFQRREAFAALGWLHARLG